jgi:hypothetical protein
MEIIMWIAANALLADGVHRQPEDGQEATPNSRHGLAFHGLNAR